MSLGSSASYFFYDKRHPNEMGEAEISTFVSHLATRRKVSPSTQGQALAALLFLYKNVLRRELNLMEIARAKRPARLPLILSRTEVAAILAHLQGTCWLMASLMYGSGLRVLECCRLRVKDIDFERRELTPGATPGTPTVRQAQGGTARREVGRSKRRSVIERIEPATWLNSTRKSRVTTTSAKRVPASDRCSVARESGEPSRMGKQKTASAGAPRDDATKWAKVDWNLARREVRRLQVRIAKAVN